jgi:dTDP-4-dehydrorhamnose 3,5-epimerase
MIEGVVVKELVTHVDERGFFREIIRSTDDFFKEGFGQWGHSLMHTGVAKAWHIHKIHQQPGRVLRVPQGVAHGCKALMGPVHLFYITSHVYNPDDEGRIAHDDPEIGYDWHKGPTIK